MIDCIENQARRQQAGMMHQQVAQIQPRQSAVYRPQLHQQQSSTNQLIDVPNNNQQHQQHQQQTNSSSISSSNNNNNELIGYYFGSISRETADWILRNHGNQMDGAYLLRSSGQNDDFVLSLMVVTTMPNNSSISCHQQQQQQQPQPQIALSNKQPSPVSSQHIEVLHYKIVETEDSFVALHGQVGDEKFATIDELIDKAQGVATKPRWPIHRQSLESQILPPTYWGLSMYQVCLAFFIKAKQWGFPLLPSLFQPPQQQQQQQHNLSVGEQFGQQQQQHTGPVTLEGSTNSAVTTLNIETMRTLIYKSLHEFQPWFHGKISRDDAERRIEDGPTRDGKFLVRERDTYSYAMCICHRRATKHYRIDVLPTGELAIQDGRKFTSLMALVSHYTIMSDGLWCALTEPCPRPIQSSSATQPTIPNGFFSGNQLDSNFHQHQQLRTLQYASPGQNLYCIPPPPPLPAPLMATPNMMAPSVINNTHAHQHNNTSDNYINSSTSASANRNGSLACAHPINGTLGVTSIKAPIKEWLQSINQKWTQLMAAKNQHQSLNSFLFGSQNPLNNHCRHNRSRGHHHHHSHHHHQQQPQQQQQHGERRRAGKNTSSTHSSTCGCVQQQVAQQQLSLAARNLQPDHNKPPNYQVESTARPSCANRSLQAAFQPSVARFIATNPNQILPTAAADQAIAANSSSSLLSCLPQSSGFQLNGQSSFIGSPLFAVRPANGGNKSGGSSDGSGSSDSNGSNMIDEAEPGEKLISPAQSISANLNQSIYQTNQHADLTYGGSQPSTAIVNDNQQQQMLTSSSSSSGTMMNHQQNYSSKMLKNQQQPFVAAPVAVPSAAIADLLQRQATMKRVHGNVPIGGHIMCGQHAGPAYRYTNCQNDENSFRACSHRPHMSTGAPAAASNESLMGRSQTVARAFDDSQLQLEPSSQLSGQAALSKFVQFQDGQCLRTHRDTRSIQMAYLSSQRAAAAAQGQQQRQHHLPFKVLNNNGGNNVPNNSGQPMKFSMSNQQQQQQYQANSNNYNPSQQWSPFAAHNKDNFAHLPTTVVDIDLMDCGLDQSNCFRVNPKLIKSSSIETLCGVGDDDEDDDEKLLDSVLNNCKSNAELLQACIKVNNSFSFGDKEQNNGDDDILKPIQLNNNMHNAAIDFQQQNQQALENTNCENHLQTTTLLSNCIVGKDNREKLDYLNKRHDLDELYTALFAELDASLKAQVDLKNKCLGSSNSGKDNLCPLRQQEQSTAGATESHCGSSNPNDLVHEFDSLISTPNSNSNSNTNTNNQ